MSAVGAVLVALVAFAVTNVDTFVFLTAVLAIDGPRAVVPAMVGEWLGFAVVLGAVVAVAAGLGTLPSGWAGLVGLLPIGVGVVMLVRGRDEDAGDPGPAVTSVVAVGAAVVGHGVDNVAVLSPLLRARSGVVLAVTLATFVVVNVALCAFAVALAGRPTVRRTVGDAGAVVLPWVYIAAGALVVVEALRSVWG